MFSHRWSLPKQCRWPLGEIEPWHSAHLMAGIHFHPPGRSTAVNSEFCGVCDGSESHKPFPCSVVSAPDKRTIYLNSLGFSLTTDRLKTLVYL